MRYLPHTEADRRAMLDVIGAATIDDLFTDVPQAARLTAPLDLPPHAGELEVERDLRGLSQKNMVAGSVPFFLGGGAYRHHVPASVDHLIQRSEFLTAYTPYQPEISQGTTQALFEFQSQVAMIMGMDVANASMYDGSTACSEAVMMAFRITKRKQAVLSGGLHPHYREVVQTMEEFDADDTNATIALDVNPDDTEDLAAHIDENTACVVVQNPSFFGGVVDLTDLAEAAHAKGALLIVVIPEIVSLGAMKSPGDMGADIVVGEGQSIGNAMNYGGPYLGLFATRQRFIRQMPGRLCGETTDANGKRGYVLTLSTREQHIRREKATSNICTNSGLCCLAFTIHMALLGEEGFTRLAQLNHQSAVKTAQALESVDGVEIITPAFFNEFTVRLNRPSAGVVDELANRNILGGIPASRLLPGNTHVENMLIVASTETVMDEDRSAFAAALKEVLS